MSPIIAFTAGDDLAGVLQAPADFCHSAHQADIRSQGDTGISFFTVVVNYFLKTLSFYRLQRADVTLDRGPGLLNHLHRRDSTSAKIGLTIGITFLFLLACGLFCVIRRRKPKHERRKPQSRSGSDKNSRRTSAHITGHIFTYRESVTKPQRKKSSRGRSRSRPEVFSDTVRFSAIGSEIYVAPPEPVYAGPSQAPNAMDAPQDFVACSRAESSRGKIRKDGKKSKK